MADKITDLTAIPAVDRAVDVIEIVDVSADTSYKGTVNNILGFSGGNPVSTTDSQTLTNKTLTNPIINTPTLAVNDNAFTIRDNLDTTKVVDFQLSGLTTGTTRTLTIPDASTTLVGTGTTQTLTNKTLTAPTITNPTLTVDTISEFTSANGVTIDGVLLKDSKMNGSYITDDTVKSAQMLYGMVRARQGGTTGDASWATVGTSNTDTSSKDVFIQVGSRAITAAPTTITFPNAYSQVPMVFATTYLPTSVNAFTEITAITTTTFSMRMFTDTGVAATTEFAFWMAVGQ